MNDESVNWNPIEQPGPLATPKQEYVVGFLFYGGNVVLIRKLKPEWQKGFLNGVGGKVEPGETPAEAMRREFREEAGLDISDWAPFAQLDGEGVLIYFYLARVFKHCLRPLIRSITEEVVDWFPVSAVVDAQRGLKVLPNLRWMIPLALDKTTSYVQGHLP